MARGDEKNWYQNPWFWGVGGCCLGCVVLPLIVIAVLGTGVLVAFQGMAGDVKEGALDLARADARVVSALGEPIEAGFMIQGSVNVNNDEGEADFSFPVNGPDGAGDLHVLATRRAGEWEYQRVILEVDGQADRIVIVDH